MGELIKFEPDRWDALKRLALEAVRSPHSRRSYSTGLDEWRRWYESAPEPRPPFFSKACVNSFRAALEARGLSSSSTNVRLTAIRRLAAEAVDNGLIAPELAAGIARVKSAARLGTRMGNWLSKQQAEDLIAAPDQSTLTGKRDRAILGVLIGCGLRRSEAAALTLQGIQQREGRWVIIDLLGKHGRVRSVAMPGWVKGLIDVWVEAARIQSGVVFRPVNRGGKLAGDRLQPNALWVAVQKYCHVVNIPGLAPHDLRRTYAKLAHKGQAALEQIQISLGHASIATTERYLGVRQDLTDAPCDHLGLRVNVGVEKKAA
ncbi:MAG: tyrosine-type recombinase/integrase [Acidobacteriia bacterium]|nr:tyrosine-type recombinase/integrase [Terriglobia bacterium]